MYERKLWMATACLLFAGCTQHISSDPSISASSSIVSRSSASSAKTEALEPLPSTLSIPHFSKMRLSGTGLTLQKVLAENDAYTRYDIQYFSNGLRISGIMNIPKGTGPFPLLILNHGYIDPKIYTQGRGLKREQDYLARAGFAILHTDYRGHADSDPSPMIEKAYDGNLEYAMDSANAILAVRATKLPSVDTMKVGMLGHSMGGGVTLALLTGRPDLVDTAVLYAPVNADVWENFTRWREKREDDDETVKINGTKETNPELWKNLSPETFLKDIRAPILLFQGSKDKDVPQEWSDELADNLRALGKDITYTEYAAEGHEFATQWTSFMKDTAEFFRRELTEEKS